MSDFSTWLHELLAGYGQSVQVAEAAAGLEFETEGGVLRIEPCEGSPGDARLGFFVGGLDWSAPSAGEWLLTLHAFNAEARWQHDGWVTVDEADQVWFNWIAPIDALRAQAVDGVLRKGFDLAGALADLGRDAGSPQSAALDALHARLAP
jgi:hypothetical protein